MLTNYDFQQVNEYVSNIRRNGMSNYNLAANGTPFDPSSIISENSTEIDSISATSQTNPLPIISKPSTAVGNASSSNNASMDTSVIQAQNSKQIQNNNLIKSSKLDHSFSSNPVAKNTEHLSRQTIHLVSDEEQNEPLNKKTRQEKIDMDWYHSTETSIGELSDQIMLQLKQNNAKSVQYINELEQGLEYVNEETRSLKEENRLLKEENRLLKEENIMLKANEMKIKQLEEDNCELRKHTKTCMGCGNLVNTVLYCNPICEETHFQ